MFRMPSTAMGRFLLKSNPTRMFAATQTRWMSTKNGVGDDVHEVQKSEVQGLVKKAYKNESIGPHAWKDENFSSIPSGGWKYDKFSSNEIDILKMEKLAKRAADIRNEMEIGTARNIGVASCSIDGQEEELIGVSGKALRAGTVDPPVQQIFTTIQTGNNPRTLDSEYKILSNLAAKLAPESKGVVDLYSELPVCVSCEGVINQFRKKFPNVQVNVFVGDPK